MTRSHIPEALVNLTQSINESSELRSWFVGLKSVPFTDRTGAFNSMAKRMRAEGQDEDIVNSIFSLVQPEIYRAVLNTIEHQEDRSSS